MNVAMACSPHCDDHVATSDIGFVAEPGAAAAAPTFTVWGAGGLGATPRLAIELRRGIAQSELLAAFDAIVVLGAKYADRSARAKAKIKLLVDAWGAERVRTVFDAEFEARRAPLASPLTAATDGRAVPLQRALAPAPVAASAIAQKQPGLYTIPALIPMGELPVAGAFALADAAVRFGDGIVHLTPDQNAELHDVRTRGRGGIGDVVSCVGLEYCPLAVAHSMTMGEELAQAFAHLREDSRYADFRIHVSGCPHSCAK